MLKKIAVAVAILLAVLLILAATKPNTFRVERSTSIQAPPEKVFALLDDFHRWSAWSPWEKMDPAMQRTYSGAASGTGAVYEWAGNSKVGRGRMEIVEATPASKVAVRLDFLEPFAAHNTAEFTLAPAGDGTNVTWVMHGPNLFIGKVMSVFVSMDRMIGKDFEAGLANLKALTEGR
jgi:uncharacterized protein YndB with AHSA1/START domain